MKIIIYDTEHFETTYTLIRLFDEPTNSITIFTTTPVAMVLKRMFKNESGKFQWVLINSKNKFSYLLQLFTLCKQTNPHLLLLNTVAYHHLFIAIICSQLKKTEKILTIHDVNNFFRNQYSLNPKKIIQLLGKRWLLKAVDGYAILLNSTKDYLQNNLKVKKSIYRFPGSIFEQEQKVLRIKNNPLKIVIPGSIDGSRRDYDQIINLISYLEGNKIPVELILLGKPIGQYGKQIIYQLKKIKTEIIHLIYYENFIEQSEYDDQLQHCDFVLIPLLQITTSEISTEEYGITKISGGFFDAIKHAKPILIPINIFLSEEIKNQCIPYFSIENLANFLNEMNLFPDKYNIIVTAAFHNSMNFTKEKIKAENMDLFI